MTVKGGKHQLTGIVQLGNFYNIYKKDRVAYVGMKITFLKKSLL